MGGKEILSSSSVRMHFPAFAIFVIIYLRLVIHNLTKTKCFPLAAIKLLLVLACSAA